MSATALLHQLVTTGQTPMDQVRVVLLEDGYLDPVQFASHLAGCDRGALVVKAIEALEDLPFDGSPFYTATTGLSDFDRHLLRFEAREIGRSFGDDWESVCEQIESQYERVSIPANTQHQVALDELQREAARLLGLGFRDSEIALIDVFKHDRLSLLSPESRNYLEQAGNELGFFPDTHWRDLLSALSGPEEPAVAIFVGALDQIAAICQQVTAKLGRL